LIGAGAGALGGALLGNQVDKSERKEEQAQLAAATAAARQGPLGLTDVVQLAQEHISDEIIINQIRSTGSVFQLSATDISWLKANGVSDAVVMEMQQSANRVPRRVYAPAPVYVEPAYQPVYYGGYNGYYDRRW
jgi:hypothetical protein